MESFFEFFQSNFECVYPVVEEKIQKLLRNFKSRVDQAGSQQLQGKKLDAFVKGITELEAVIIRYESASLVVVSVLWYHRLWFSCLVVIKNSVFLFVFLVCRNKAFLFLHLCTCPGSLMKQGRIFRNLYERVPRLQGQCKAHRTRPLNPSQQKPDW
jgi:hypothetical protein